MKVTIKDIAKEAGVSYQTVSKALLGKGEVKEETALRLICIMDSDLRLNIYTNSIKRIEN